MFCARAVVLQLAVGLKENFFEELWIVHSAMQFLVKCHQGQKVEWAIVEMQVCIHTVLELEEPFLTYLSGLPL